MTEEKARVTAVDAARLAVEVASEKQATDIVMLDMRGPPSFTDYFVILSAESRRQMQGLLEDIDQTLEQSGMRLHHREGTTEGGWVLLTTATWLCTFSPKRSGSSTTWSSCGRGRRCSSGFSDPVVHVPTVAQDLVFGEEQGDLLCSRFR